MTELILKFVNPNNKQVLYAIIFNLIFHSPANGDLQVSYMSLHDTTSHSHAIINS